MTRLLAGVLTLTASAAAAEVRLPAFFSDHAVLQRGPRTRVWGTADPGERVTVELAGRQASAVAGADGRWQVAIGPLEAGGPHVLTVRGRRQRLRIADVMVGEVWLASGQSNMEFALSGAQGADREIAQAAFPGLREFAVPKAIALTPSEASNGAWAVCSPRTAGSFSAVAYFFARELHRRLGVPVGIVHASWGGTPAEAWTSRAALTADPGLKPLVDRSDRILSDPAAASAYEKALAEWEERNVARDESNEGLARGWARPDFDDSAWKRMVLPGAWEKAGLALDGAVWFRRAIDIPASWAGRDLELGLGAIDDFDTTWYDGEPVGSTGPDTPSYWTHPRRYVVPGRLVRAGRAVVAVRAFDRAGDGGLTGPAAALQVGPVASAHPRPLTGEWAYAVERAVGPLAPDWGSQPTAPLSQNAPSTLYNAMIAPLTSATVRGVIWYQGEANVTRAYEYRRLLPTLIADWRRAFAARELPFLFVQLANFLPRAAAPGESAWAELREAQLRTLAVPHTGMAVAIDVGEADDIHPRDKRSVGHRLALLALDRVYGRGGPSSGPLFREARVEGRTIRVGFLHADGLRSRGGAAPSGFSIAGADRRFVAAEARLDGAEVVVSSPEVAEPIAVRYGWADNPLATLVNGAGLPASPFRTDDWPGLTAATAVP